jgi:hypothetical protein
MNTENTKDNLRENLDRVVAEVVRLRDEARVRLNLLGKELRDRWGDLDQQVDEVVRVARQASDAALTRARALREELQRELTQRRDPPASPPTA